VNAKAKTWRQKPEKLEKPERLEKPEKSESREVLDITLDINKPDDWRCQLFFAVVKARGRSKPGAPRDKEWEKVLLDNCDCIPKFKFLCDKLRSDLL